MVRIMVEKTLSIKPGSVYWIDVEPHSGREQGGHLVSENNIRRPVVVVSNERYNEHNMALVFACTSTNKKNRYLLPIMLKKPSNIILSQILGYDMVSRNAQYMGFDVGQETLSYLRNIVMQYI
ncbi:mRNA interferase MazF [Fructobacillus durionis]|uniref:mRNA interferase MazF n=2 Tax=Fructobacillus durionis TaxID=283737 RepID=A0A1I1EBQ8_9LACO|nr:mRNA interferase MazF [Fructobacillus durionis]